MRFCRPFNGGAHFRLARLSAEARSKRKSQADSARCRKLVFNDDPPVLLAYLEQALVPKLQQVKPEAILVMDNLRPHHATEVRDLLNRAGIGLLYLPRYSPEFNPNEPAWGKMKEQLKAKAART